MTTAQCAGSHSCDFGPLVVRYDARVLTPRPWTLLQSRWAAELAVEAADGPILELCAGAGQIGLAASVLTGRALVQVEADEVAAGYARTNAALTGRADQVEVRHGRVEAMLATDERFPIVLADPPYLPSTDVARWPDDPLSAIDGGKDGLELVRTCLRVASDHLQRDGVLLLQVAGAAQADAVTQFLASAGHIDLATIETRHHDSERAVMLLMHTAAAAGGRVDPA